MHSHASHQAAFHQPHDQSASITSTRHLLLSFVLPNRLSGYCARPLSSRIQQAQCYPGVHIHICSSPASIHRKQRPAPGSTTAYPSQVPTMDLGRENMASHLLAALSLPPIRDDPPYNPGNEQQSRDRPLPLEPSTTQDVYRASQYQQGGREPAEANQQVPSQTDSIGDALPPDARSDARRGSSDHITVPSSSNAPLSLEDKNAAIEHQGSNSVAVAQRSYTSILPSTTPPAEGSIGNLKQTLKQSSAKPSGNRRVRRKWTEEETNNLIKGCHIVRADAVISSACAITEATTARRGELEKSIG